jgi:protein-L-isoaspartate(D-aspartate) O-methyltransferase
MAAISKDAPFMATATLSPPATIDRRQAMIDSQLRPSDVIEPRLIAAIRSVDREAHVPAPRRAMAYADRPIPLSNGRALNAPLTTARMIADLAPAPGSHILLIGGATGYAAAVLAAMGVRVTMVEEDADLALQAQTALADAATVNIVTGPLTAGAGAPGPYDALLIEGAVETIPPALLSQLADGAPVVAGMVDGAVTRIGRGVWTAGAAGIALLPFADIDCVRLPGFAAPRGFTF